MSKDDFINKLRNMGINEKEIKSPINEKRIKSTNHLFISLTTSTVPILTLTTFCNKSIT